jgi:putative restriction endonuclease
MNTPTTFTEAFQSLRTDKSAARWSDRTRNRAPHKPILLLVIIDLIARGELAENRIVYGDALKAAFRERWQLVMNGDDRRGDLVQPFWHMQSESFWLLQPREPEAVTNAIIRVRSQSLLEQTIEHAMLDESLWRALGDSQERETLRETLLTTYFDAEAAAALRERR